MLPEEAGAFARNVTKVRRANGAARIVARSLLSRRECIKLTTNYVPTGRQLIWSPARCCVDKATEIGKSMYKIVAACAAVAVTALIALPNPAGASERRADGMRTSDQIEVSSARRHRRYGSSRRYYARHYYSRPYYEQPSYGYAQGPSWGPAPFPFIFGLPR